MPLVMIADQAVEQGTVRHADDEQSAGILGTSAGGYAQGQQHRITEQCYHSTRLAA